MSLIGKNVGNYRVVAKIGEGGMGSVYLGEHPMIGKKVAIKTLHPDLAQKEDIVSRFFTEARAVNDIAHPNIVDIVDFGKMPDPDAGADIVYFVMEFLDGEGLNVRLKRDGVSPRDTIHIIRQCASALAASHKKGIVHRDLKPENIYLIPRADDPNYIKLLDFGIAKLTGEGSGVSQHKTRTGLVIGTPAYMSPEQCEGKGNIDSRSDVYSLGVVMYEMLTGRVPFPGDGFGEVLVAHLMTTPELPSKLRPEVPASLEAIVMHAMEKDKNRRFQTMDELVVALDDPGAHLATYGSPSGRSDSTAAGTMMMQSPSEKSGVRNLPTVPTSKSTGQGQRPTTLSGATGEVSEVAGGATGGGSKLPIFAVLGVLIVGGGAGGAFLLGGGKKTDVAAAGMIDNTPKPVIPQTVKILIDSQPRGAKITRAGVLEPVGTTPYTYALKKDEPEFDVLLALDGYESAKVTVTAERDREMMQPLKKIEIAPPPPQPEVVKAPPVAERPAAVAAPRPGLKKATPGKKGKGGGDKDDVMEPTF